MTQTALSGSESPATDEETRESPPALAGPEDDAPRVSRDSPRGLYAKLAAIMGELETIPKSSYRHVEVSTRSGGSYSYDYITEGTLMEALRPKLARDGIAVMYSDTILRSPDPSEDGDNLTVVRITLTFIDGETGEKWNSHSEGYGTDLGDKGANKAKTSAMRYLLWKMFLFASDVDPETENVERRGGGGGGRAQTGAAATDKQKDMVRRIIGELSDKGTTLNGLHPDETIHRRTAVEDMTRDQASRTIDLLIAANKAKPGNLVSVPDPLDEILGPLREPGDFPPDEPGDSDQYGG